MVLTGSIICLTGAVFLLLAALGLIRMPDSYNRMQTGTKATTLGSILFLTGIAVASPSWLGRIILLIVFIVFTNPLSSHALARAAHKAGVSLGVRKVKDSLETDEMNKNRGGGSREDGEDPVRGGSND